MLAPHQRLLCLFGYETDGGDTSRLWQDPDHVALPAGQPSRRLVARFQDWQHSKRAFLRGEVITGVWITIRAQGAAAQVQCHPDGRVTETTLFALWTQQPGTWSLVANAVVRLQVAGRELDIIANRTGWLRQHSVLAATSPDFSGILVGSEPNSPGRTRWPAHTVPPR
jgi:hypothetical protein